jgi:hypothetical protein
MKLAAYYQYLMNVLICNVRAESVLHLNAVMTDKGDEKSARRDAPAVQNHAAGLEIDREAIYFRTVGVEAFCEFIKFTGKRNR